MLVFALVMGSAVAFAGGSASCGSDKEQTDNVRTFFSDFANLFRKQIPDTANQETHNLFEQTRTAPPTK